MTMDGKRPEPSTIAAEGVGERLGDPTPEAVKDKPEMPTEESLRRLARSAGPQARVAEKTAESVGERIGDAYADATTREAQEQSRKVVRHSATQAGPRASSAVQWQCMGVAAGFAFGYAAALLIHRGR